MAELVVEGTQLVLRLAWWEKIAAVHGNIRVPLSSVDWVRVEARGADVMGLFSDMFRPGSGASGPYGVTRDKRMGRSFLAVSHPRRPAVLVHLNPPPSQPKGFRRLLVYVADPEATAARIIHARYDSRGAEGEPPGQTRARRLWLPWRPWLRLIFAYPRALAYVKAPLFRVYRWLGPPFTWWRVVIAGIVLLPFLYVLLNWWILVGVVTIIAFGVSFALVVAEWLLLALMFPFVLAARLASRRPWPLIADAWPERWTARVAGWGASEKAAADAAGALTSGAAPAAPPWSPGARRAKIWTGSRRGGAWTGYAAGTPQTVTANDRWDYTVAELRQIAAEHNLPAKSRMTHNDLVSLITEAGIKLPEQLPPYLRDRGPQA